MITLVIHPEDRSTDFLKPIYENIKNVIIVTGKASTEEINQLINNSDRVIMLGHGSPNGLFGINFNRDFVISSLQVEALRKKKNNAMYIWCNADQFVHNNALSGMYSGMFISEVVEANYCGLKNISQHQVTDSNDYFAKMCGRYINESFEVTYNKVKENYSFLAKNNPVADYNCSLLRYKCNK